MTNEWKEALVDLAVVNWTINDDNADDPWRLLMDTVQTLNREMHDPKISALAAKAELCDWLGKQISYVTVRSTNKETRKRLRLRGDVLPASEAELRAILTTYCERYEKIASDPKPRSPRQVRLMPARPESAAE